MPGISVVYTLQDPLKSATKLHGRGREADSGIVDSIPRVVDDEAWPAIPLGVLAVHLQFRRFPRAALGADSSTTIVKMTPIKAS